MSQCIDLTSTTSITGKTLDSLTDEQKQTVSAKVDKTIKKTINQKVKSVVLEEAHRQVLEIFNIKHLTYSVMPTTAMVHKLKPTMKELLGTENAIKVGDFVEVMYEYAPGTCSDGGVGIVSAIIKDEEGITWCTVGYVLDKRIETGIHEARITVTMMPFKDFTSNTRSKRNDALDAGSVILLPDREMNKPDRTSLEWLEWGLKSRTHEKKGWLKEKLLEYDLLEGNEEALWKRVISDYKCQMAAIEGMRLALGLAFKDPRDYKGVSGSRGKYVLVTNARAQKTRERFKQIGERRV